jgi:CheY-like chemotaxis protein
VKRKLLLADDSVTIQRVVELTFSGEDIDVVAVGDGEQAIARIEAERPDIVLADIAMPKKNGYEVAAFVKEHPELSHVPVLLLAGTFEPVDDERARRVKCDGVLVKPFETHEVIARVRGLLDGERKPHPRAVASVAAFVAPQSAGTSTPAMVEDSVDDYFDRLDAAFAAPRTPPPPSPESAADGMVPTLDTLFTSPSLPQQPPRPFPHLSPPSHEHLESPAPPGVVTPATESIDPSHGGTQGTALADLFHMLLEVEQGERDASAIRVPDAIERISRRNTIE